MKPKILCSKLSSKNINGSIPSELTKLGSLEELWLDGNAFTGSILDFTGCPNLKIM
ncbi:putative leucine-rich repeat domain superfamily [Helianthus annuus]|nr:putative leucine-rich repeat domain superfamily [Helianthus annuus]